MMKKILNPFIIMLVIATFPIFVSCEMDDVIELEEPVEELPDNFAIVEGFLTTGDGDDPLVGFPLIVVFSSDGYHSDNWDVRGEAVTDETGFYQMEFAVKADEVDPIFDVILAPHTELGQGFAFCYSDYGESLVFQPKINETTVLDDFFVPEPAHLVPQAVNSDQIGDDDTLLLEILWDNKSLYFDTCERSANYPFDQSSQSDTVQVAANIPLLLRTTSIKDGVRSETTSNLTLQTGEVIAYDVVFE